MTAVAVAARLALDTLKLRAEEVEAALSHGMSERDSRMEIIGESATNRHAAGSVRPRAAQHRIRHPGWSRADPRPDSTAAL
jgi:hypothetical protein